MKTFILFSLLSLPVFASTSIIIDIDQKDVSHPELIKINYLLDRANPGVYFKITVPGREFRAIMPELSYKAPYIYFENIKCAQVKFLGLQIVSNNNCKFEVKSMRVNHGDIDPVDRDVFRVFLTTRSDQ